MKLVRLVLDTMYKIPVETIVIISTHLSAADNSSPIL